MQKQKKILIIRNDKIGDLIFSTGVFREIKKIMPSAIIDVVASPENIPIIEKNKNIHKIYSLKFGPRTPKEFYKYFLMARKLKKEDYDIGIEMRGSFFNILLLLLSGIKNRAGFYNLPLAKKFLNMPIERDITKHESVSVLDLVNEVLNIKAKNNWPDIATDKGDQEEADKFIKENKLKKFFCIVPEATIPRRQWPVKNFIPVANFLKKNYPKYKILVVGMDTEKVRFVLKNCPFCIPLVGKNVRVVHLIFKKSKLSVVVDGAPNHLAWSSKSRVLAIMSKYLVGLVRPLGNNATVIAGGTDDINANDLGKVSIKEVKDKINKILKNKF